jgi:threonyl-tRNA synthetase
VPVAPPFDDYAKKVQEQVYGAGFQCEVDLDAGTTMNKKIRNAQLAQYNFIFGRFEISFSYYKPTRSRNWHDCTS